MHMAAQITPFGRFVGDQASDHADVQIGGSARASREQDISQKVTLSWPAMWLVGAVRCSSVDMRCGAAR
jgi:hypothetical protein